MKKKTVVIISVLLLIGLITVFCACYQPIIGATRVTVNYYDGETLLKSESLKSLEQALEYIPAKEGMEFKGWYLDNYFAVGLNTLGETSDVEVSVYAYFEPLFFEVVFLDDDNNVLLVNDEESQSIRYGSGATAPAAPEKSGFVFDGWSVAFDNVKSDLTIRPTWQAAAEGCALVFMLGSELLFSEEVEADTELAAYANTVEENLAIPRGFAFDAWFYDSALTLPIAVNAATVPQTGLTLFAKLKLLPITGLSIAHGSEDAFVYSEDLKVLLTAEVARHDNITYDYEWYFGEVGGSAVSGNLPSVTLEGLDAGAYTVAIKVTASAPNAGSVSVSDTISFDVELASLEDLDASDRIEAAEVSVTYDGKPHRITITGLITGDTVSYALFGDSYSSNEIDCIRAGVYNIAFKVERRNYIPFEGGTILTVTKAPLTVKVQDKTVIYGDLMPSFTYTYSGFVNGEDVSVVTGDAQYAYGSINTLTIGQFAINVGGFTAADYEITYLSGYLTVNKRPLYITADDKTAAYGGIAPIFTAKITGFFGSDGANLLDGEISFDCEYALGSDAGNYPILPKGLSSDKYEMSYVSGNLAVSKRSLTVTADNKTAYYGDNTPTLTVSYSGFIEGDDENGLEGELLFNCRYRKGNDTGTYSIAPEGLESANYNITFANATLTVHKVLLNITADDYAVTYGDNSPDYSVRYSGFITGENESKLTGILRFECVYAKGSPAGSYSITAGGLGSNNYDISYISGSLTVEKKALTVTADNKAVVYGDSIPTFSTRIDGFIEGDSACDPTGEAFFYCEYVLGSGTGSYDIEISNLSSPNYIITFVKGTLQVDKATLTVTAANKAVIYGANAPAYTATYSGFITGDGLSELSGTLAFECEYSKGSPADNYTIKASGFDSDNYNIVYVDGTLEVGKRNIELKVRTDFAYNGNVWEKSDWSGVTGLYGSDEVRGTLKTVSELAGVYAAAGALSSDFVWVDFDISSLSESVASSYDISYALSIEIKENCFDYTANDTNATYNGGAYSISVSTSLSSGEITYSENGVDYGSDNPSYTQAGTYTVYYKISDSLEYYDAIIGTCEVRIAKVTLTVTAADAATTYGQSAPSFSVAVTGYVNGENASVLGGSLAYDCNYEVGSGAGTYTVMPYGLDADNYRFEYIGSVLTVGKAALTVTAANKAVAYGDLTPQYSAEFSGLAAGDTELDLSGTLEYNCGYIAGSALGSYPITPYGLSSSNYQITYAAGTLTVSAKSITVYAEDKTTVYGLAAPNFSAACDELFGSDTIADIVGLTFECNYATGDGAKDYTITVSGGSNTNYLIGYSSGTLTVTPKQITVTASDKTVAYGTASVAYTIEASGLITGDNVAMLGTPGFDCEYAFGSSVGSYTITPKNLTNANYSYIYADGTLTVTAKSVAVIWYGTDVDYYYNASDQSGSVTPGITDIYDNTIYTSVTFVGAGSSFLNAGNYILTASLVNANYTLTNTIKSLRMFKGEYSGITHSAITNRTYSPTQTLSDIALADNYFWANPGAVPTVPVTGYAAYYNADYDNYNNFALTVTVNLQKALAVVTGSTIQEATYGGGAASLSLGVSYEGAALPASLYTFKYTNGNSFTAAGTYKTSVTITSDNFRVNATDCYMKVKGVLYGSTYYTIEDALNAASSGTVIVATDTSFASADNSCYNGSGYYTVKSGVHLLVPYSNAHSTSMNTVNGTATALGSKYVRLTVPSGVTLTVKGTLNVNAERSHQSTRSMGHTSGSYGEMKLEEGSLVILNSGATLNSMGFVTGTGYINALSGSKVYDVLAIKDFRGGKISYSIRNDYFAFNQYTMHNIEANLRIYYGSSMYCRYYVYTSVASVNSDMIVVGNGAVFQLASGYLQKYMDAATGRTYLDLYGTMTTNSVTLELNSGIPLVGSFSINTANKEFPLSGNYTVSIKSGSTGTINNRFKLLPGAEFIVEQGATLNITSSGRLYMFGNGVTFSNGISEGTPNTPAYGSATCRVNTRTKNVTYSLTDNARLIINGTLNMAGYIGGLIETSGTTGVINLTGTLSSTMKDRLNVTKVNTFGVDYTLDDVAFTAKGYLNGNTSVMVNLSKTTYHADSNGTNTWVQQ